MFTLVRTIAAVLVGLFFGVLAIILIVIVMTAQAHAAPVMVEDPCIEEKTMYASYPARQR